LNSSNESPIAAPGGGWFPTKMEMVVVAFCLSGVTDGAEAEVLWFDDLYNRERMASIPTFGNSCHTQFYGCEDYSMYHESRSSSKDDRIVITARFSMLPKENTDLYLAQVAMDKIKPESLQHEYKWIGVARAALTGNAPKMNSESVAVLSMEDVIDSLPNSSDTAVTRILHSQGGNGVSETAMSFWDSNNKTERLAEWLSVGDTESKGSFAKILLSAVAREKEDCNWMQRFLEQKEQDGDSGAHATTPTTKPNAVAVADDLNVVTPEQPVRQATQQLTSKPAIIHATMPKSVDNLFHFRELPEPLVSQIHSHGFIPKVVKGVQKPIKCVGIPGVTQRNTFFHWRVVLESLKRKTTHRCIVGGLVNKQRTIKTVEGRPPPIGAVLTLAEYSGTTNRNSNDWINPTDPCEVATFQEYRSNVQGSTLFRQQAVLLFAWHRPSRANC